MRCLPILIYLLAGCAAQDRSGVMTKHSNVCVKQAEGDSCSGGNQNGLDDGSRDLWRMIDNNGLGRALDLNQIAALMHEGGDCIAVETIETVDDKTLRVNGENLEVAKITGAKLKDDQEVVIDASASDLKNVMAQVGGQAGGGVPPEALTQEMIQNTDSEQLREAAVSAANEVASRGGSAEEVRAAGIEAVKSQAATTGGESGADHAGFTLCEFAWTLETDSCKSGLRWFGWCRQCEW